MTRDEIISKLHNQIDHWNDKIIEYEKKLNKADHEVRLKLDKEIDRLQNIKESVEEKLKTLEKASEPTFEKIKTGIDSAIKDLNDAFSKFSMKIYNKK